MKLLTINPDSLEVELNKEWIFLVPDFAALFKRDKGSEGDYRGDKKQKARKEITFIYYMEDFASPLRDWDPNLKWKEALKFASRTEADIDELVTKAQNWYHSFVRECAPSLRTLDALYAGREELNRYFREVNFKETDKLGKSKYTAKEYIGNIKDLPAMNRAIKEYERQVDEELRESTGIRGKSILGTMEGQRKAGWDEGGPPETEKFNPTRKVMNYGG